MQDSEMRIVGYSDRWSVAPSDRIRFFVSTDSPEFRYRLVRLGHGLDETGAGGPAPLAVEGALGAAATAPGGVQEIFSGSSMHVDGFPSLERFTFCTWIWPTAELPREQCVAAWGDESEGAVWRIGINAGRHVICSFGAKTITLDTPVPLRQWSLIVLAVDGPAASLHVRSLYSHAPDDWSAATAFDVEPSAAGGAAELIFGAAGLIPSGTGIRTDKPFNGKISTPVVFDRALGARDIVEMTNGDLSGCGAPFAAWDFVGDCGTDHVRDTSGHGFDGTTRNRPGRLVTGHNFSGQSVDPEVVPHEYNAVYFHDDDLADARWQPSFHFDISENLQSGIYAAEISTAAGDVDYLPFAVRPPIGTATAKVALLLPTVSYMVYGNEGFDTERLPRGVAPLRADPVNLAERAYCRANRLLSLYDFHTDGSGVSMATMHRPVTVSFRPDFVGAATGSGHQLSADLQLVDWLEAVGIDYDVITDHELHTQGASALAPYNAVLTGTHAEYWTEKMIDGLATYQAGGGRFVYLSGNGLYWVTGLSEDGTIAEVQRPHGTRPWSGTAAESHISLTGEPGGLWRHRGRAPQTLVGVGFAAQGWDRGQPFVRQAASYDPRAAFIFAGVDDTVIGDFPAIALEHGPAGFEFDRADFALGTPPHALILASATGFAAAYQNVVEEVEATGDKFGGPTCERVRADMVFFETPNGGAVFSGSSINFCCTLSYGGYENNVSKVLENVVRAFGDDGPLPKVS